jgi:hypothetical protein
MYQNTAAVGIGTGEPATVVTLGGKCPTERFDAAGQRVKDLCLRPQGLSDHAATYLVGQDDALRDLYLIMGEKDGNWEPLRICATQQEADEWIQVAGFDFERLQIVCFVNGEVVR